MNGFTSFNACVRPRAGLLRRVFTQRHPVTRDGLSTRALKCILILVSQEVPPTRRKRNPTQCQEPCDPERLPGRIGRGSWFNTTRTGPPARPGREQRHRRRPRKPPGTRAQRRRQPRCPAGARRPASGATCVRTAAAASPTRRCWSATGACTRTSGPSPAPSAACASRGSSRSTRTSGSTAPARGAGGAGGLASALCRRPRAGMTGTRPCCSATTRTSSRSAGEWLPRVGLSLTWASRTGRALRETPKSGAWEPKLVPCASLRDPSGFQTCKKESACKDSTR